MSGTTAAMSRTPRARPRSELRDSDNGDAELDAIPLNRRHLLVFALCGAGLMFESVNLQLMGFVAPQVAADWHLSAPAVGALLSAAIVGMIVGTFVFGAIADRFGRRGAFQITVAIFSLVTAVAGLSTSYAQLLAARFGAGVGIGGSIPVETAVLTEFTPKRWRSRVIALWALALPIGGLIAPTCVALVPNWLGWRGLLFAGGIPALLVLAVRRVVPETPAYLRSRGRDGDAEKAVAWIARRSPRLSASNGSSAPIVHRRTAAERSLFAPGRRSCTLAAWLINFGSFFAYYGTILWMPGLLSAYRGLPRGEVIQFMLVLAGAGIAGRLVLLLIAPRASAPALILLCMIAASLALATLSSSSGYQAMLLSASAAIFFLEGSFSIAVPLVANLYPPAVRATGVGWAGGVGRAGAMLAPMAVGYLVGFSAGAAILALGLSALLAAAGAAGLSRGQPHPGRDRTQASELPGPSPDSSRSGVHAGRPSSGRCFSTLGDPRKARNL